MLIISRLVCPTPLRVEPPQRREEVPGPDHRLVPVLSQLWDGRLLPGHQQEPAVQAGEGDEDLHRAAVPGPDGPLQGEVN